MGDQPKPVQDELERALTSMRAGFLSGSEQIATGVASLEDHLVGASDEDRAKVGAAVARLVATHERLTSRMTQLPASPWDSFRVMVSATKAQQAVLDEVSHLVKEYVLPRQLESLAVAPFAAGLRPSDEPDAAPDEDAPPSESPAFFDMDAARFERDAPHFPPPNATYPPAYPAPGASPSPRPAVSGNRAKPPPRRQPGFGALAEVGLRAPAGADPHADDEPQSSFLSMVRERTSGFKGIAAMIVAGVLLSVFPHDLKLQEMAARLFDTVDQIRAVAPPQDSGTTGAASAAARASRSLERVPAAASSTDTDDAPAVASAAPPSRQPAPAAPRQIAAAVTPVAEPTGVSLTGADERFVPVVFTHKDYGAVMQALTDLRQQYPGLLVGRDGEVQPVDLGKKGIWHRLVLLPAGPKPQAARLCDQLAAAGYDRCWVKAY